MKSDVKIKKLMILCFMASLVVVFTFIKIPFGEGTVHLGNGMCLLSGLLLSPIYGGFAAGFGSVIYDIFGHPTLFSFNFLITFVTKFMMGFSCSIAFNILKKIFKDKKEDIAIVISAIIAEIIYIILYLLKTFIERKFILKLTNEQVIATLISKGTSSVINAVFACILVVIFYKIVKKFKISI